ncbi:MAG: GyrI-like domain-containing protein [Acidobacteriota bacterium]
MDAIEKSVNRKTIVGISIRTTNRAEMNAETAQIPSLWQTFYQERLTEKIPEQISGGLVYGVYSSYESDLNGAYTLTAGLEVKDGIDVSQRFSKVEIAEGKYLVFHGQGAMPQIIFDTWGRVWALFSSNSQCKRAYTTDFEVYQGQDEISIYISIK